MYFGLGTFDSYDKLGNLPYVFYKTKLIFRYHLLMVYQNIIVRKYCFRRMLCWLKCRSHLLVRFYDIAILGYPFFRPVIP